MPDPTIASSPFLPPPAAQTQPQQPTLGMLTQPSAVQQGPPPQSQADLDAKVSGWDSFFSNPAVATALLQFGVNLLQPRPMGQSVAGAAGAAVGAAGEAVGRVQKLQFDQDRELAKEGREQQRVGLEGRRVAAEEQRTQTDAQRAKDEAEYRQRWLDIQQQQVRISSMNAGIASANNALARERLTQETRLADERLKLETNKLAQDWLIKHSDRKTQSHINLVGRMYTAALNQPRMPGEPAPDIDKIGQDALTLIDSIERVNKSGDVFQLGTPEEWTQTLSDPQLRQQAIETFGAEIITKVEKELKARQKAPAPAGGPR